ncbi:hypothetical protein [Adhaeribacter rhizoryzae]|uniref:DUF4890 domain-containing protein n=1 Tax=Adhaeribacter rhizoryzae TaxID=2607907 RepID=A0A5M6DQE3_9BACT|nr:hypothetical protein [Adhaeribacter rhizoryzae]KAA5547695.1 hypothetical protein F0145_07025 [Adhaeribacter rhizoryzae]
MKKLILSIVFVLGVFVASAQNNDARTNKDFVSSVSTNDQIRQLSNKMQLNEGQYIRLRDLSRAKNEQIREINNMYVNDATTRQQKLQAVNQDFEKQLAQTVSQEQFTAYLATQGRAPMNNAGNTYQATGYGGQSLESGAATGTSVNGGAANPSDANINNNSNTNVNGNDAKEKKKAKKEKRSGKMKSEKINNF